MSGFEGFSGECCFDEAFKDLGGAGAFGGAFMPPYPPETKKTVCRYDGKCTALYCKFFHPNGVSQKYWDGLTKQFLDRSCGGCGCSTDSCICELAQDFCEECQSTTCDCMACENCGQTDHCDCEQDELEFEEFGNEADEMTAAQIIAQIAKEKKKQQDGAVGSAS